MKRATCALTLWLLGTLGAPFGVLAEVRILGDWRAGTEHAAPSAPRRALIFTAHAEDDDQQPRIAAVTYGGQAMTRVVERGLSDGHGTYAAAFILDEIGLGKAADQRFTVTWESQPARPPKYTSVFVADVDQDAAIGDVDAAAGQSPSVSTKELENEAGDLIVLAATAGNPGAYSLSEEFTEGVELAIVSADGISGHSHSDGSERAAGATHSHGNRQVVLGFVVRADRGSSGTPAPETPAAEAPATEAAAAEGDAPEGGQEAGADDGERSVTGARPASGESDSGVPLLEVKSLAAFDFFLVGGSKRSATAWLGERVAVVLEDETPADRDPLLMARVVRDVERYLVRYAEIVGTEPPTYDAEGLCDCAIWQVVKDSNGVDALGMVGAAGLSTGLATFDRIYNSYANGRNTWDHLVLFEFGRNYWSNAIYSPIAYEFRGARFDVTSPWMTAFNNFFNVELVKDLELEFQSDGKPLREYASTLRGHLAEYMRRPDSYHWDNSFAVLELPWESRPASELLSGLLIYLSDAFGGDGFAGRLMSELRALEALPSKTDYQQARDNFYVATSKASGKDLKHFFEKELSWTLSERALVAMAERFDSAEHAQALQDTPSVALESTPELSAPAQPSLPTSASDALLQSDFSSDGLSGWTAVDQGTQDAPSNWFVEDGVLHQHSDIEDGSSAADEAAKLGTFLKFSAGAEWTDYSIDLTLRSDDDDALGIMFRIQDDDNYYRFSWDRERRYRRLSKCVNGEFSVLAEDQVSYESGAEYRLRIAAYGDALTVHVEDSLVFEVNDSSVTSGTVGFYAWSNRAARFDNLTVKGEQALQTPTQPAPSTLSTSRVLLEEAFEDEDFAGWSVVDEGSSRGPSQWTVSGGELVQASNIAGGSLRGRVVAKPGTYLKYDAGDEWTDYRLRLTLRSEDDDALGVMFRVADADNFYRFSWDRQRGYRRLVARVDGEFRLLGEDAVVYERGRDYAIEILAQGPKLAVNVDGEPVFNVADDDLSAGTVGLYTWANAPSYFSELSVETLEPSAPREQAGTAAAGDAGAAQPVGASGG